MMSGIFTIAAFAGFLGVCVWAYSKRNRAKFDDAAQLPLTDEPTALAVKATPKNTSTTEFVGSASVPDCCKGVHS